MQKFEKRGGNNAYNDSGDEWLLQSGTDALQKNNERLEAVNKQKMAKYKRQDA